jgi:phosphoesterase RecJ-like protein
MGYVLCEKMKIYPEYGSALITLTKSELERFNYEVGDTEGFVNLPLQIDGVNFVVFLREDEDYVKVSLRSVGDFPSNQFAAENYNGGGHKNASGGEFYGSMADAIRIFEECLTSFYAYKWKCYCLGNP